jgi:3-dehydroquinate synthase
MKELAIDGASGRSTIMIGASIKQLAALPRAKKIVIITDRTIRRFHEESFPPWPILEIGTKEISKNLATVESLYNGFFAHELDRSSFVVAIGGGLVCDVAGFAASTFMRGLSFGFVPTTLLAQVDASIGGKNGVNFQGYKNLIGTFTQPEFVLCDFNVLKTVPEDEQKNGFAEVVKHAAIGNEGLFAYLESNWKRAIDLEPEAVERIVFDSISLKSSIVNKDELEKGERRKLNFGHTIGHALEKVTGVRHGEAISIGMIAAARLSMNRRLLSLRDVQRIESLLINFRLPIRASCSPDGVVDAVFKDKKRENKEIHFVLLDRIGSARVEPVSIEEIREVFVDLC